jgi:ATP-binding cassette subfamily B protein
MSRFGGFGRGGGGWQGAMGATGGLTRTYGLQWHFMRGDDGPMPRITRASLRRIGSYFRPYWKRWTVILSCIAVTASLNVLPPFCVAMIIDRAIPTGSVALVGMLAMAIVGLALLSSLIGVLQQTLTAKVGQGIMFDLRNDLYAHLQQMGLHFYTATRSGEVVSRISNDVNAIQGVTTGTIVAIAGNVAGLTAASVALFSRSWQLALLALCVVPAFYLPSKIVGGIRRRLAMATQEAQASLLAFMTEHLHVGGAVLTKVFGQRQADAAEFRRRSADVRDLTVKGTVLGRWLFMPPGRP